MPGGLAVLLGGQSGQRANFLRGVARRAVEGLDGGVAGRLRGFVGADALEVLPVELVQPAIVLRAYALFEALAPEQRGAVTRLLPNSLGEFSALAISRMAPLEQVLELALFRGEAMQEVFDRHAMVTLVVRGNPERVRSALADTGFALASLLSPGCLLVSGPLSAASEAKALLRQHKLPAVTLSGRHGFHHPLLRPAADRLHARLRSYRFDEPQLRWFANFDGEEVASGNAARLLSEQLCAPVLFAPAVEKTAEFCSECIDLDSEGFLAQRVAECGAAWRK